MRRRLCATLAIGLLAAVACDAPLRLPEGRLADPVARARGRALYVQYCALCHGQDADGRGVRRRALSSPARDFARPAWRETVSPREVHAVIREGIRGTSMPGFAGVLDDEALLDLTAYVLSVGEPR